MALKKRTTHWLRPNTGSSVPRNLVFVQVHVERLVDDKDPNRWTERLAWGIAESVRYQNSRQERWQRLLFTKSDEFWAWLIARYRSNTSVWLIGHGIARTFTLLRGWELLDSGFWRLTPHQHDSRGRKAEREDDIEQENTLVVDNDPPVIMLLHHDGWTVHVVDIENYGRCTLSEVYESIHNVPYERPADSDGFDRWRFHLEKVVESIRKRFVSLLEFWLNCDLGNWRHTLGGLAMAAYRHRFMGTNSLLVHNCLQALEVERESLVGGEFRCFWVGRVLELLGRNDGRRPGDGSSGRQCRIGPIYQLDVNSLYPSVMRGNVYPRDFVAWKEPGSIEDIVQWQQYLCLIARVYVATEHDTYPVMVGGERQWAVGRFWTTLAGPELKRALQRGHILAVGRLTAYGWAELFTQFVEWFHQRRLSAISRNDEIGQRWAKSLPCALAGKFGQWHHPYDSIRYWGDEHPRYGSWVEVFDDQTVREFRSISGQVQIKQSGIEALNSIPAIEAYVNSYARCRMDDLRKIAGIENLIYQDSDGLHVTQDGFDRLQSEMESMPHELGKLRLVRVIETAEYRGPHDYTANGEHCVAGLPADADVDQGGNYDRTDIPTMRMILTRQPGGFMRIKRVRLSMGRYHPRGVLHPDGRVTPVVLDDPPDYQQAQAARDRAVD
jgi:hypothetical protein